MNPDLAILSTAAVVPAGEVDHRLEARSGPPSESYLHRSRPSRYEGMASAATLLRNAQLKAAAVDAGRSAKMKNVAFRAATIKAAIANSYAKRHHDKRRKLKRSSSSSFSSAGQSGNADHRHEAGEASAEAHLDMRAVERARRNVSNRPSGPHDHRARSRSPRQLVKEAAATQDATSRPGEDRFRPREITKDRGQGAERTDLRTRRVKMETRTRGTAPPL